jgi:hypothetical protein
VLRPTSDQVANSQRDAKGTEPFADLEKRAVRCCFGRSTLRPYNGGMLLAQAVVNSDSRIARRGSAL